MSIDNGVRRGSDAAATGRSGDRPVPLVTPLTKPYWRAAKEGRLVLQHCSACEAFTHFPADACAGCGRNDQLGWLEVSGQGRIYTFSVIHRGAVPGFAVPYVIAWVDLAEGPRVFGNVLGCRPEDVHIGMPVEMVLDEVPGFGPVPSFAVAGA